MTKHRICYAVNSGKIQQTQHNYRCYKSGAGRYEMRNIVCKSLILAMSAVAMANPFVLQAQSIEDPVPIQGNMVTETAAGIAVRSANGGYGPVDNSPRALAQKQRVNALISQYGDCRANARNAANPAHKKSIRAGCVRSYNPQFAKACVGGALSIAICMKYKRTGSIE
jgi:hypothetical protein